MNIPLLLLIFNRPETTLQVINALRAVRPRHLYVAADGPRASNQSDIENTKIAREIATRIDWPCEVKTLFRDENLGCRRAVSSAIDWFFDQVEEGIILEDDCVPSPSFFTYTEELLARYRNDQRVMVIGAQHFHGMSPPSPHSYFFSGRIHCWGWASWRRAWTHYDRDMFLWPVLRETNWLLGVGSGRKPFQKYWINIFDRAYAGKIDSWAYRWAFSCWAQSGLTIVPAVNLVTNIGFSGNATHTTRGNIATENLPLESLDFPLVHPDMVIRNVDADLWSDHHIYDINFISTLKSQIVALPGGKLLAGILRSLKSPMPIFPWSKFFKFGKPNVK
jgi:hypothetical protein